MSEEEIKDLHIKCARAALDGVTRMFPDDKVLQLLHTITQLRRENEGLREALKFYADEMNYSTDDYRGISGEMITRCVLYSDCEERNDVYSYAGRRAREALKDCEEL
jgi:hypothetical protein